MHKFLPGFRTKEAQGRKEVYETEYERLRPTFTHCNHTKQSRHSEILRDTSDRLILFTDAVAKMLEEGFLSHVITQNADGAIFD